jgi:hypothetical protein
MTTIFDSAAPVKTDRPFGTLPARVRRQTFGDLEDDRLLEEQALQAAWDDQFNDSLPAAGHCLMCGDRCHDLTFQGLCDRCDDLACDATTAGQNARAGLGHRVY